MKPEDFEEFIRKFLPKDVDPADLARAAGLASDPKALEELINQLSSALGATGALGQAVNWDLAKSQAISTAKADSRAIPDSVRNELDQARRVAELWLAEATAISATLADTKLLTRELWVADAINLFQQLAGPVADRMSVTLSENLQNNMPEELGGLLGNAAEMMKSAGSMLFAMQLGQAIGKLSTEVIAGNDTGLPIIDRPALVVQNLLDHVDGLAVDREQALIYLTVRELAATTLFRQAKWLRENVTAQIGKYAADITIDNQAILDASEGFDSENPDSIRAALESGAFIAERSPEQLAALENIEATLAIIDGWIEAVTDEATKRLPKQAAIAESVRRRRAVGSPAERTFATLVGLELRPRKLRESALLWQKIGQAIGTEARDELWQHPDLLPTAAALDDPDGFISALRDQGADRLDDELRKLLGEGS